MSGDSSIHSPNMTTTIDICQTVKIMKNSSNRKGSNPTVTTHRIDDWKIQESLQPFPKESDVHQWNIDDVCVFVEYVLGTNCYTPIIQEHLIDGIALVLVKEEHLANVFQMPSKQRTKLLHRIHQLQI